MRPPVRADPGDSHDDKAALRRELLARRQALDAAALDRAGRALAGALLPLCRAARQPAAYVSVGTEPPTRHLLDALPAGRVLLPVLQDDGDLDWALHDPAAPLARTGRGLLEPTGERRGAEALSGCDLVLVPALAVDRAGRRLGRGGGSYDRALPRAGDGLVVALLHDGELLDALPAEPHDVPVDAVVVPSLGLLRLPLA